MSKSCKIDHNKECRWLPSPISLLVIKQQRKEIIQYKAFLGLFNFSLLLRVIKIMECYFWKRLWRYMTIFFVSWFRMQEQARDLPEGRGGFPTRKSEVFSTRTLTPSCDFLPHIFDSGRALYLVCSLLHFFLFRWTSPSRVSLNVSLPE